MKNENFGGEQRKSALKLFELKISGIIYLYSQLSYYARYIYLLCLFYDWML